MPITKQCALVAIASTSSKVAPRFNIASNITFARNHNIPIEWAQKGVRKEDHVLPWLRRMRKKGAYGVYFIFKSMEQGPTFRISVPKYPTKDPNHRILAH